MLEKLKNLEYVSLKEAPDLNNIELLFITFGEQENDESSADVYTKWIKCGDFEIDDIENLPDVVEELFVNKVNELLNLNKKNIININNNRHYTIPNLLKTILDEKFAELEPINKRFNNKTKFVMIPENFDKQLLVTMIDYKYDFVYSKHLKDEIIFGYKNGIDQPGLILITNEKGLEFHKNIRLAVADIGFFPEKCYYKIKINPNKNEI